MVGDAAKRQFRAAMRRTGRLHREKDPTMTNVVIVSAARTAVGSFNGAFANTPAHDLGAAVLEAVVARAGVDKAEVSEETLNEKSVSCCRWEIQAAEETGVRAGRANEYKGRIKRGCSILYQRMQQIGS